MKETLKNCSEVLALCHLWSFVFTHRSLSIIHFPLLCVKLYSCYFLSLSKPVLFHYLSIRKNVCRMILPIYLLLLACSSDSFKVLVYNSKFGHSHSNYMGRLADIIAGAGHDVVSLPFESAYDKSSFLREPNFLRRV